MKKLWSLLSILILVAMTPLLSEAKGLEEFSRSVNDIAAKIAGEKKFTLSETEKIEDEAGFYGDGTPFIVYGRLWQTEHTLVSFGYNEKWQEPFLNYFSTDDPELKFYGGIKIGVPWRLLKEIFSQDDYTLLSEENNCFVIQGEISQVTFGISQDKVAFIRAAYGEWPIPKKISDKIVKDGDKWDESAKNY